MLTIIMVFRKQPIKAFAKCYPKQKIIFESTLFSENKVLSSIVIAKNLSDSQRAHGTNAAIKALTFFSISFCSRSSNSFAST